MIRRLIADQNFRSFPSQVTEEIYANCLQFLWSHALPRYDAWRWPRVKPSTYMHRCLQRYITREYRRIMRAIIRESRTFAPVDLSDQAAADVGLDKRIEAQARDIIRHPNEYLSPVMVEKFQILLSNPGVSRRELAELMGYENQSALSMMLRRMREAIADVDIEQYGT